MKNTLYMLNTVSGLQAQSFILTTVLGGVIIIDGGTRADSEHMLCRLREITGLSRPHVDAWILTHPHFDHADCFLELMRAHRGDFTLDKVICAFPSAQYLAEDPYGAADTVRAFYALLPFFADKFFPVTAGDKLSVSGANLHFLYTPDWTIQQDKCNNSSLVVRIELAGRVLLFTGDCAAAAGERILSQWGLWACSRRIYARSRTTGRTAAQGNFIRRYPRKRPFGALRSGCGTTMRETARAAARGIPLRCAHGLPIWVLRKISL